MARETVDAALVEQFKTFLKNKDMNFDNLTTDELKTESLNFLIEKYPGAKEPPNQLVELMTSPSAAASLANMEMVNPEEKKQCSDDGKSGNDKGDKKVENEETSGCPNSNWFKNIFGDCIYFYGLPRTKQAAVEWCTSQNSQLLEMPEERASVMYQDMQNGTWNKGFLGGYLRTEFTWLNVMKVPAPQGTWVFEWINGSELSSANFPDVRESPLYVASHECLGAKPNRFQRFKFHLRTSECETELTFFCQVKSNDSVCVENKTIDGKVVFTKCGSVDSMEDPSRPNLPSFPCFENEEVKPNETTISRKKRETNEVPKNIEKLDLLLDPERANDRKEALENATRKYNQSFGNMDFKTAYENLFEILWYSQLPCFDVQNITSNLPDQMSIIKKCIWKGKEIPCPAIFKTLPTDRGMCCTFNMKKAEDIFQESMYSEMVQGMQDSDESKRYLLHRLLN